MSSPQLDTLCAGFPGVTLGTSPDCPQISAPAGALRDLVLALRDRQGFDYLPFVAGLDRPADGKIEVVYRLFSYATHLAVVVRVLLPRDSARVPTISDIYPTADWHERETAELLGVVFEGHPDPRRLLTPDGLEGYPLRKDFTHPNLRPLPEARS